MLQIIQSTLIKHAKSWNTCIWSPAHGSNTLQDWLTAWCKLFNPAQQQRPGWRWLHGRVESPSQGIPVSRLRKWNHCFTNPFLLMKKKCLVRVASACMICKTSKIYITYTYSIILLESLTMHNIIIVIINTEYTHIITLATNCMQNYTIMANILTLAMMTSINEFPIAALSFSCCQKSTNFSSWWLNQTPLLKDRGENWKICLKPPNWNEHELVMNLYRIQQIPAKTDNLKFFRCSWIFLHLGKLWNQPPGAEDPRTIVTDQMSQISRALGTKTKNLRLVELKSTILSLLLLKIWGHFGWQAQL